MFCLWKDANLLFFFEILVVLCGIIVGLPLALVLLSIFNVTSMFLLLLSLLVIRMLQLIRCGDDYERLFFYKHLIRTWLYVLPVLSLTGLWLTLFPIVKLAHPLKEVTLLEVSLTKWVDIFSITCGLCSLSSVLYVIFHSVFEIFARLYGISRNVGQAISEIIDSVIFWGASILLKKLAPSFKHHEILGLSTQNWIKVSIILLISYNLLILLTNMIVWLLRLMISKLQGKYTNEILWRSIEEQLHVKHMVFFANGMTVSVNFVICSLMLLLTWIMYFGSHLDLKPANSKSVWDYGKWTFISLLILSFLWVIKNFVLLMWEAHTVYERLQLQIVSVSEQLYYFLVILGSLNNNFLKIEDSSMFDILESTRMCFESPIMCFSDEDFRRKKYYLLNRKAAQDVLMNHIMKDPSLDDIQRASKYFLMAKQILLEAKYISQFLQNFHQSGSKWRKIILGEIMDPKADGDENQGRSDDVKAKNSQDKIWENIEQGLETESSRGCNNGEQMQQNSDKSDGIWTEDLNRFLKILETIKKENSHVGQLEQESSDQISNGDVKKWVERARKQCINVANTLSSAKELADCLDKIISWLLLGAVFIMWLLLTKLATTKVLVLIASPLLAASFIFGDTCKTLFQGIIYVFVVHPFDVGDLCIIEEKMLEVRSIGVWTSKFTKVDKIRTEQEQVIYSNSELMNKIIINHKTKFDWSDCVEFNLGPVKKIYCEKKNEIIKFFKDYLKYDEEETHVQPNQESENALKADNKGEATHSNLGEIQEEGGKEGEVNGLDPGDEKIKDELKQDEEKEKLKKKKLSTFLTKSPNLSVSTKEDNITLIICVEYKAGEDTDKWTYSECLHRKDDLKGEFYLHMYDAITIFKAEHGIIMKEGESET